MLIDEPNEEDDHGHSESRVHRDRSDVSNGGENLQEILGSMLIATEDGFQMKIDERPFRVAVRSTTDTEGLAAIGWELPTP